MSTLSVENIKSGTSSPPIIKNSSDVEVGKFCRAWVNFNGTGTVAIRAAFNVTSVADNGTGDYTVNFTNAMPDANYAIMGYAGAYNGSSQNQNITGGRDLAAGDVPTTSGCRIRIDNQSSGTTSNLDPLHVHVAIIR
jgi:hypothetical protein